MNAKKDFSALSQELITIVNNTANVSSTVAAWWITRLNGVINGTDKGLTNPQGYFLNGIAPTSRRCQGNVKALFVECLLAGYTGNAEVQCRTVNEFSQRMMQKGLFESFARRESQYGDKDSRLAGAKVSHATMPIKVKKEASKQVGIMADARDNNLNAKAFETSMTIDMIIQKYSNKPEVVRKLLSKPEVVKQARGSKPRAA